MKYQNEEEQFKSDFLLTHENLIKTLENLPKFNKIGISLVDNHEELKKKSFESQNFEILKVPIKSKQYIIKQYERIDFGEDD